MDPFTIGLTAVSAGASIYGGITASSKAKKAGKRNAKMIRRETAEQVRRLEYQNRQTLGQTVANIGASGVRFAGTPRSYLNEMQKQQQLQVDWLEKSGRMRARIAEKTGQQVGDSALLSGAVQGFGTISQAYTSGLFDSTTPDNFTFKETSPWQIFNTPIMGGTQS